jgi:signal transduction protein with GAF and PtsI domain
VSDRTLRDAVAASSLAGAAVYDELLQSIIETARAIFVAQASSIILYDEASDELVFRAATGTEGSSLIGRRFPAGEGIAGYVLRSRDPLILEDVTEDPRFARDIAESTGYVPRGLMAVPLLRGERTLGVLQVLDRASSGFKLAEMDLLALFARQAAIALDIVEGAAAARQVLSADQEAHAVARIAEIVDELDGPRRSAAIQLINALATFLESEQRPEPGDEFRF